MFLCDFSFYVLTQIALRSHCMLYIDAFPLADMTDRSQSKHKKRGFSIKNEHKLRLHYQLEGCGKGEKTTVIFVIGNDLIDCTCSALQFCKSFVKATISTSNLKSSFCHDVKQFLQNYFAVQGGGGEICDPSNDLLFHREKIAKTKM